MVGGMGHGQIRRRGRISGVEVGMVGGLGVGGRVRCAGGGVWVWGGLIVLNRYKTETVKPNTENGANPATHPLNKQLLFLQ
jgi:hypothetical protein